MKGKEKSKSLSSSNFGARGWLLIIIIGCFLMFSANLTVDGMNVYLPFLSEQYGIDYYAMLAITTPVAWVGNAVLFFVNSSVNKHGARKVTFIWCLLCAVSVALFNQVFSLTTFIVFYTFMYMALQAVGCASHYGYISHWFPKKKGIALGWCGMGLSISPIALVPLLNILIEKFGVDGWHGYIWAICAIFAVLSILVITLTRDTPEELGLYPDNMKPEDVQELPEDAEKNLMKYFKTKYTIGGLFKNANVWKTVLAFGFLLIGTSGFLMQIVPRLTATGKVDQSTAVTAFSLAMIVALFANYFWGWLDGKIGVKAECKIFAAWYVLLFTLLLFLDYYPVPVMYVVVCMGTFGMGGIANIRTSMAMQIFGRYEFVSANRILEPLTMILGSTGGFVLSWGLAVGNNNWAVPYGIMLGLCVISLIIIFTMPSKSENDDEAIRRSLIEAAKADTAVAEQE